MAIATKFGLDVPRAEKISPGRTWHPGTYAYCSCRYRKIEAEKEGYGYRGYSLRVALVIYFGRPPCWVAFLRGNDRDLSFIVISLNFVQSNFEFYSGIRIYFLQVNF